MADTALSASLVRRIAGTVLIVLAGIVGSAFALLRSWHLAPRAEGVSARQIATIPPPRLQVAPQLDRAPPMGAPVDERRQP